jgi:hypothetical protein
MPGEIIHTHVILEWRFVPDDFFGESIASTREGYVLSLSNGKAEARIDGARFAADESLREQIHRELVSRFAAAQLLRHQPYELHGPVTINVRTDGTRDMSIELRGAVCVITGGIVGVRMTDPIGDVVFDSEQVRREEDRSFVDRVAGHSTDPLMYTLLNSYKAAVRDPDNELVHLYELRDALATRFGGDREARTVLKVSAREWSRFGQLCNEAPLRQGRHRGKASGTLRDATEVELVAARAFGRTLLDGYLDVLDGMTLDTAQPRHVPSTGREST